METKVDTKIVGDFLQNKKRSNDLLENNCCNCNSFANTSKQIMGIVTALGVVAFCVTALPSAIDTLTTSNSNNNNNKDPKVLRDINRRR